MATPSVAPEARREEKPLEGLDVHTFDALAAIEALDVAVGGASVLLDAHDWRVLRCGERAARLLQLWPLADERPLLMEQVPPSMADALGPFLRRTRERGEAMEQELPGGGRRLRLRASPVRAEPFGVGALLLLVEDVTDERQTQDELAESRLRFHAFAQAVDDGVFVSTLDRAHFHFISDRTLAIWGMDREELASAPACFVRRVDPEDLPIYLGRVDHERRLQSSDVSFRIRHRDGGIRWLRSRTRAQPLHDGQLCVYGLITDVTEERERQIELQRTRDAAEAASRAKSDFLAAMSHEVRTPMNGILGMTELLLGTELSDKQRRFAQAVLRSGETLLEIVSDVLDFSTIESGRLALADAPFVLRDLVEDTLELLSPRAHAKRLELVLRIDPALPLLVTGDAVRWRQVLTNLVANAIKFTDHGQVVVDVREVTAATAEGDSFASGTPDPAARSVQVEVVDTGIGIEPALLARLFEPFTQGQRGMDRRYGGMGLGLSISRQLVERMGGRMAATSQVGNGSRFTVTLPLRLADPVPALRVLLVGVESEERALLQETLAAWGLRCEAVGSADEALSAVATATADRFDLALVSHDWAEPLARGLRRRGIATDLALLMLSAPGATSSTSPEPPVFRGAISRPVRPDELRRALMTLDTRPSHREEAGAVRPSVGVTPSLRGRHVLVVEDNVVNQEVIAQMLRSLGCRVRVASNAGDGLKALCETRFDLVLMDIQMPGMDGTAALQHFKRGPTRRHPFLTPPETPVIAVTANALAGDAQRFLGLGFDDYLSKPFRQNQLHTMLTRRLAPAAPATEPSQGAGATPAPAAPAGDRPAAGDLWSTLSSVLDPASLERLKELDPTGASGLLQRVLVAFEGSLQRLLQQLHDARSQGDHAAMRHVAHTLKSSSASVGALELSRLCADIERRIRQDETGDLDPLLDGMVAESSRLLSVLTPALHA